MYFKQGMSLTEKLNAIDVWLKPRVAVLIAACIYWNIYVEVLT